MVQWSTLTARQRCQRGVRFPGVQPHHYIPGFCISFSPSVCFLWDRITLSRRRYQEESVSTGGSTGWELTDFLPSGSAFSIPEIPNNLSGITFIPHLDRYLAVRNSDGLLHVLDGGYNNINTIDINGPVSSFDLEDVVFVGQVGPAEEFALVNENGEVFVGEIDLSGSSIDLNEFQRLTYAGPPTVGNNGGEGLAYDPSLDRFWACTEKNPMIIYQFDRLENGVDGHHKSNLVVTEPFDAQLELGGSITDMSSCLYNQEVGRLLILSNESSKLLDVSLTGDILAELPVQGAPQWEGVTLFSVTEILVSSEPNWLRVYRSSLFSDGFESGGTSSWSVTYP